MVLRKPPPPRLENPSKWSGGSNPRSPASPSTSSPSSQRRARLNRIPSQDSIYSPDLNTSPAFDLMPLEEAQRSSVGSSTSPLPNSWPDGRVDAAHSDRPGTGESYHAGADHKAWWNPSAPVAGPQGVAAPSHDNKSGEVPVQLQSNNPFLKPTSTEPRQSFSDRNEWNDRYSHATTSSGSLSQTEGYIPMTARLSVLDPAEQQGPPDEFNSPHSTELQHHATSERTLETAQWDPQHSTKASAPQGSYLQGGQANPYTPTVVVQPSDASTEDSHSLQPTYPQDRLGSDTGIQTPSAISSGTSATSHELIDVDGPDNLAIGVGSARASSSVYPPGMEGKEGQEPFNAPAPGPASSALLDSEDGAQEGKSPASSTVLSPAEAAKQKQQRAETYAIRQINWTDSAGHLLQSPILVQNQNGPCPLLALINALVLNAGSNKERPIIRALRTREQISLGLLIEALFEELTISLGAHEEFPDIEALTQFLTMLHTGMNVNPCLALETTDAVGTFLQTPDIRLYSTFGVPLVHGWLASWSSPEHAAMTRTAQYHEDIQLLPFRMQELEDRVMQGQSLLPEDEQKMADTQTIQKFVNIENTTQLSPFGLTQLTTHLRPGSVSILFRNDHFATLYKHPLSHQLFTLVTDAGYANHAEVVWESLVDVTGFNSEFLSGDFRAVGHGPSGSGGPTDSTSPADPRTTSVAASNPAALTEPPEATLSSQEQSDADYAYALTLQFQEEEQRAHGRNQQGQARTRRPSVPARRNGPAPRMTDPPNRHSSLATSGPGEAHSHNIMDPDDPNAPPPPYEQAASGPRYSPPDQRVPQASHQASRPSPQYPPNRHSRDHAQNRPVSNRYTSSSDRGRSSKDCVMM